MIKQRTSIIPTRQTFCGSAASLDHRAICVYAALGFFLDTDTFWTGLKTLPVASDCEIDEAGNLFSARPYFRWRHEPRDISFERCVEEFTELFEGIVAEQIGRRRVILPLSGGLDSRTLAAALKRSGADVTACSYYFSGGHDESEYASGIANAQKFPLHRWRVEPEYLWDVVDDLAKINGCYSEFTHPRQMNFRERFDVLGDIFCLGHWGDVLFDDSGVDDRISVDEQSDAVVKKVVKKGGLELGAALWNGWGLAGEFRDYLRERIGSLLAAIDIPHSANARIRAFRSMHWAPRWTSVNLSVFESVKPVSVPYYDNRICEFICTVPEAYLSGRKIQIEYLKRHAPALAKITWQQHRPFNLISYRWNTVPWNLPPRLVDKFKRTLTPGRFVQRNWELQFLGEKNDAQLRNHLFGERDFAEWIPQSLVRQFYDSFRNDDPVYYSHSVSMLLTLSLFARQARKERRGERSFFGDHALSGAACSPG